MKPEHFDEGIFCSLDVQCFDRMERRSRSLDEYSKRKFIRINFVHTKRLLVYRSTGPMMWDNTRPMKGINSIHVMNEGSFTLLLAFAPGSPGSAGHKISPRFATATHGGFMRSINVLRVVLACLLLSGMVLAQGLGASGDIRGTVTDPSGAVVSNAVVTATDVDKGVKHTISSDNDGQFHFSGLPPATYTVGVTKTGFQPAIAKNVVVTIGQTNTLNFPLKVSQVSEQVEVTTEMPVVETERGSQANVVSDQYIRDLPINRRDYLTFTLLAPGVSDSTRLASDQDFRVKQTPQSGLSFYG